MKKPRVLFFHLGLSPFVKEDLKILEKKFSIEAFYFKPVKTKNKILSLLLILGKIIRQFGWILNHSNNAKVFYCWFSDYHAIAPVLLSRITRIPCFTVLGGSDSVKLPSIKSGIFNDPLRSKVAEFVVKNSTLLLPVDGSLISTNPIAMGWQDAHPNGLRHLIKNFKTPYEVVHTGYDSSFWHEGPLNRNKSVLTVAVIDSLKRIFVKGVDLFIETSKELPDFTFTLVGASAEMVTYIQEKYSPGINVNFKNKVSLEELKEIYTSHSVYAQLSRNEGLPNALCEAMMSGCVPVGSPVFGIPTVIADVGFIARLPDSKSISELIQKAHNKAPLLRQKCHQHIYNHFPSEKREAKLTNLLLHHIKESA